MLSLFNERTGVWRDTSCGMAAMRHELATFQ